jgi:hypothetical protein
VEALVGAATTHGALWLLCWLRSCASAAAAAGPLEPPRPTDANTVRTPVSRCARIAFTPTAERNRACVDST